MAFTISKSLIALGVCVTATIIGPMIMQLHDFEKLRIKGPVYDQIVFGKDVIADILPPPLFVVESYMLTLEANQFPEMRSEDLTKIAKLRKDYQDRRDYWAGSGLRDDLKAELADKVVTTGDKFWEAFDTSFVPALKTDDNADDAAALLKMNQTFHSHQMAVLGLVENSTNFLAATEKEAEGQVTTWQLVAYISAALSILTVFAGLFLFKRRAIAPVIDMTGVMTSYSQDNYAPEIPHSDREDEIGAMAKAVSIFRQNGLQRQEMQRQEEEMRQETLRRQLLDAENEKKASIAAEVSAAMAQITDGLNKMSQGDLSFELDLPFSADLGHVRSTFNNAIYRINEILIAIDQTARELDSESEKLNREASGLTSRAEQQAETIEQSSVALSEISSVMRDATLKSENAGKLVEKTKHEAAQSRAVVSDTINAIERISESSGKIGKIISVIDEIAFQTNLLALNAGVEAARAGDAGRGFAVVAQEVRELASRSANAAREIKGLVQQSATDVESGVMSVNKTGDAIRIIENGINEVNDIITSIVSGSRQQSVGVSDISAGMQQLEKFTQQNAEMAARSGQLIEAVTRKADALADKISGFKLQDRQYPVTVPSRSAA